MTPPINIDGTQITGASIDGQDVSEITVDGTQVFSQIRDSEANQKLEHRYILNTLGDGTAEDSVGSSNGTNNGVASVNGNFTDGSAGDGDGSSSFINIGTLGDYGSKIPTGAFAFTIKYTSGSNSHILGSIVNQNLQLAVGHASASTGQIFFDLKSSTGRAEIHSTQTVDSGNEIRVVVNLPSADPSTYEIFFNQTQQTTNVDTNTGTVDFSDFTEDIHLFARNGGLNSTNHIIDDICLFNDSLTQSEIQSYRNPF